VNSDLAIFAVGFVVTILTFAGAAMAMVDKHHMTLEMLRERNRAGRRGSADPAKREGQPMP
jgi:TRAP-type C4-dicarboxylate transport system permease small subunit